MADRDTTLGRVNGMSTDRGNHGYGITVAVARLMLRVAVAQQDARGHTEESA